MDYRLDCADLGLLQSQSTGGQVADLSGAVVLDSTGVGVTGFHSPQLSVLSKEGKGLAVQLYKSLADNGLVSTVAASMFIILVMGIPPATHSSAGARRLETLDR